MLLEGYERFLASLVSATAVLVASFLGRSPILEELAVFGEEPRSNPAVLYWCVVNRASWAASISTQQKASKVLISLKVREKGLFVTNRRLCTFDMYVCTIPSASLNDDDS